MKKFYPACFVAVAFIAMAVDGNAADFTVDGINYTIVSEDEGTVSVAKDSHPTSNNVVIPSSVSNDTKTYTVTEIEVAAFDFESSLTSVTIPSTVVKIGDRAFNACSMLQSAVIGDAVVSIGDGCFRDCSNMTTLTIGKSLSSFGDSPFFGCSSLTEIVIDSENSSLDFKDGILYADNMAKLVFCCRGPKTAVIPDEVTEICPNAFRSVTSLESVTFGKSVTTIGRYAFYYCRNLTEISIPEPIDNIGEYAFGSCSNMTKVSIGSSITRIYSNIFSSCPKITEIHLYATTPPVTSTISNFSWSKVTLYVPAGSEEAYAAADPWKKSSEIKNDQSGIGDISADSDGANAEVRVSNGSIVISEAGAVSVYDVSGRLVYGGSDGVIAGLQPGVYIVSVSGRSVKVKI